MTTEEAAVDRMTGVFAGLTAEIQAFNVAVAENAAATRDEVASQNRRNRWILLLSVLVFSVALLLLAILLSVKDTQKTIKNAVGEEAQTRSSMAVEQIKRDIAAQSQSDLTSALNQSNAQIAALLGKPPPPPITIATTTISTAVPRGATPSQPSSPSASQTTRAPSTTRPPSTTTTTRPPTTTTTRPCVRVPVSIPATVPGVCT